jgi:hypothetical protein
VIERRKVWECVGCGRIDDPRPCVGICRDQPVEYVLARDHEAALEGLLRLARTIATTTPRPGEHARHWEALQREARRVLSELG